tara:strand:+ start:151 stop:612 length:462 start_codon:yes stop_codon:yes gene_type:complete
MNWYILYTKPRAEKKVEKQLLSMGIDAYCPTYSKIKYWSDRKKKVDIPVLPSMVLVRLDKKNINIVFESSGVVRYMFWLGKRAIVKQFEIDILKRCLNGGYEFIEKNISNIKIGDNFRLNRFNNENGIVNRISNRNIWIYLKSVGYSIKLRLA